jgi:hypothetical protein
VWVVGFVPHHDKVAITQPTAHGLPAPDLRDRIVVRAHYTMTQVVLAVALLVALRNELQMAYPFVSAVQSMMLTSL